MEANVERLFPFVLRSRTLIAGRDSLQRARKHVHFILITTDLSAKSRETILKEFSSVPILEHYTSGDLEKFFGVYNAKVVGFKKSSLAQSIYEELKEHRVREGVDGQAKESASDDKS